jgi:hypothetical protein
MSFAIIGEQAMNEEEFDAVMKSRPFGTGDVVDWEADMG